MVFGMISNPVSVQAAEGTSDYVADLLGYYKTYQEAAATDIERVLSETKSVDEAAGEAWENIMNYWSDVNAEGKYYTDAVCWAYETGVTTGTDGKFNPTDKLTRQQMAAFFFRYLMRFCAE